jgi:protein-L-isoaspartate(D-aspartate) O-methyltransferase
VNDDARKIRLLMELRRGGVTSTNVLSALERVPRDNFVLPSFADQAYENTALPINQGQTISQPYVVAFMTQALELDNRNLKVLEIGTGSGYQAAVLSKLVRRVFTVERYRSLYREAEAALKRIGVNNVVTKLGDGMLGWPEQAPFDRIIVTAAAETVPDTLKAQLKDGGILVIPVGRDPVSQALLRIRRQGDEFVEDNLLAVRFVPLLPGIAREASDNRAD